MHYVMASCAKRYQVAYGVYLIRFANSGQRRYMMNMNEVSSYRAVLVFIVQTARLARWPIMCDAQPACGGISLIDCQLDSLQSSFCKR
jgi:hypothetical protein